LDKLRSRFELHILERVDNKNTPSYWGGNIERNEVGGLLQNPHLEETSWSADRQVQAGADQRRGQVQQPVFPIVAAAPPKPTTYDNA